MVKDHRAITVNAVGFPQQGGTVLYACSSYDAETSAGHGADRTADKIHLVSLLREHFMRMEGSPGTDRRFSDRADLPIQVTHDALGRPQLLLGECEGPSISFSEGGGRIWAALCGDAAEIGIDAAGTDEFPGEYPFHRVFHAQELRLALRLTSEDLEKASALLWSIKESAVKALGCAFHLVDPRQIHVYPSAAEEDEWHIFAVGLEGRALARFPMMASRCIRIRSLFQEKMWLSIALLNGKSIRRGMICSSDLGADRVLELNG